MLILPFFAWSGKLSGLQLISVSAGIPPGCGHPCGQPLVTEPYDARATQFVTGFSRIRAQFRDRRDQKHWQRCGGSWV